MHIFKPKSTPKKCHKNNEYIAIYLLILISQIEAFENSKLLNSLFLKKQIVSK